MKLNTLSTGLLAMLIGVGLTATSQAQFGEVTNWSSSRNQSSNQSWSVAPGGVTYDSRQEFGGHDAFGRTVITPGRTNSVNQRSDFGGYRDDSQSWRPVPGGYENRGFSNNGVWRRDQFSELNRGWGGNFDRGINTFDALDNRSGWIERGGPFGVNNRQEFNHSNGRNGGTTWNYRW